MHSRWKTLQTKSFSIQLVNSSKICCKHGKTCKFANIFFDLFRDMVSLSWVIKILKDIAKKSHCFVTTTSKYWLHHIWGNLWKLCVAFCSYLSDNWFNPFSSYFMGVTSAKNISKFIYVNHVCVYAWIINIKQICRGGWW